MNKSIPSGTDIEFVNLTSISPLISKCEIKILYTGKNRNKTFFTKDVANRMAQTLPGTPIVGQYFLNAGDFGDHGEDELVIDEHGVRFVKDTVPYGFVPTEAKAYWKFFIDKDSIEREYLVTEAYLWTGRYPEAKKIIEEGRPQSMELDRPSLVGEWSKLSGEWAKDINDNSEYFIVNDATFSALCILGDDVEPCFEGSSLTQNSNLTYSLEDNSHFQDKMTNFKEDLKEALTSFNNKGGTEMSENENEVIIDANGATITDGEFKCDSEKKKEEDEDKKKDFSAEEEFAKKKKEDEEKDSKDNSKDEDKDSKEKDKEEEEDDKKKKKGIFQLDEATYNTLVGQFNALQEELNSIKPEFAMLKAKQAEADNKAKDDMINSFYMLSDEDKKSVVDNKANFSLEDIESKLSVICVRNKVNFNLEDNSENEDNTEAPITTFNLGGGTDSTPAWLKAVDRISKTRR